MEELETRGRLSLKMCVREEGHNQVVGTHLRSLPHLFPLLYQVGRRRREVSLSELLVSHHILSIEVYCYHGGGSDSDVNMRGTESFGT